MCEFQSLGLKKPGMLLFFLLLLCLFPQQYAQASLLEGETCRAQESQPSSNSQETRHMRETSKLTEHPKPPRADCRCISEPGLQLQDHLDDL